MDKGYQIGASFIIKEKVSGSIWAIQREGFKAMVVFKLMTYDTLNSIDLAETT